MDKTDSKEIVRSEELTDPSLITLFDMEIEAQKKTPTMAYLPSFFTTASLPFKNVHKPVFVRKGSNGITLTLSSPKNVPFGKYGRLLLSILTTHAVLSKEKNQSVLIEYKTLAELLRELQLPKQRGKDIKEQLECFSNATFAFDIETKELSKESLKQVNDETELIKDLKCIQCYDSEIRMMISRYFLNNPSEFLPNSHIVSQQYDKYFEIKTSLYDLSKICKKVFGTFLISKTFNFSCRSL